MKKILLILFLSCGHFIGLSQQVFTIRLLDSESNQPIKQAKITFKEKVFTSNHLGFVQVELNTGDTLIIEHNEYESASISLPRENSFQVKLTKKQEDLKCSWSSINFIAGDYYYRPIKISQPTIEDYDAYLILSKKKKAFFVVNSKNSMISSHKVLKLETETFTIDLLTTESKKKNFQVLPDKINRGQYFTIGQKEKKGVFFNLFEISVGQINQLRNHTVKTIKLGEELVFNLDNLTGRKIGKMFDCVE
jgi:hypothetical protein